jgi:serine/threonine-protein kinase
MAHGGTSKVYLARDRQVRKFVVVKWLTEQAAADPQHRQRFLSGARATMAVDHPAIARVLCVGEPQGRPPYLVMQALEGESLAEYLERQPAPDDQFVLMLIREVAAGLAAAHDVGIVHRDIKPGNLFLVGPLGTPIGVKIIDFGLSKDLSEEASGPSSMNLVLGTAQYMAPEQVLADPVDARTDIYAFGVVLFRVLTGQLPFDLDPSLELFGHQLFSPAPPPSWLNEDIDPRLEKLVLRCMQKNPANRYASMHELLEDFERIAASGLKSEPVLVPISIRVEPDVYRPQDIRGFEVAQSLAEHIGAEMPAPPASFEPLSIQELSDADLCPVSEAPATKVARQR